MGFTYLGDDGEVYVDVLPLEAEGWTIDASELFSPMFSVSFETGEISLSEEQVERWREFLQGKHNAHPMYPRCPIMIDGEWRMGGRDVITVHEGSFLRQAVSPLPSYMHQTIRIDNIPFFIFAKRIMRKVSEALSIRILEVEVEKEEYAEYERKVLLHVLGEDDIYCKASKGSKINVIKDQSVCTFTARKDMKVLSPCFYQVGYIACRHKIFPPCDMVQDVAGYYYDMPSPTAKM